MSVRDVTTILNSELSKHDDIQQALRMITACPLFGRETRSAALGEISEHLVARLVNGNRNPFGRRGADIVDAAGLMIEVKSRIIGKWRDSLMFDFSVHTGNSAEVYCIAWDSDEVVPSIREAFAMTTSLLSTKWGGARLKSHYARTTLGQLRQACLDNGALSSLVLDNASP